MDSTEITKFGNSLYLDGSSYLTTTFNNIFGNNSKKGLEELNTYYTKLMQSITDIIEL